MDLEMKALEAEVKAVPDESPTGSFEAILSTKAIDRDGESIQPGAFEPLPGAIPLYHQHDWLEKALPIGSGTPYYDGDVLKIKGTFASTPRGQEVRTLVNEGHLPAMSVGFISAKKSRKAITKAELIEGSFTGVPVNSTAAVLASKSFEARVKAADSTAGSVENSDDDAREDAELVQALHDMAAQMHAVTMGMGADCQVDGNKAMGHAHVHSHGRMKAVTEGASPIAQPAMLRHFHPHNHPDGQYDHMADEHPHEHSHGKAEEDAEIKAQFSDKQRQQLADDGVALPDGSFPIRNRSDLENAIHAIGRASDRAAAMAHIKKRAAALGATDLLPDDWKDLTDAHPETKATAADAQAPTTDAADPAAVEEQEQLALRARALNLAAL